MRPFFTLAAAAILAICFTGCDELTIDTDDQTECIDGQCKPKLDSQSPARWDADLFYELHENWGGGSCVHASTIDALGGQANTKWPSTGGRLTSAANRSPVWLPGGRKQSGLCLHRQRRRLRSSIGHHRTRLGDHLFQAKSLNQLLRVGGERRRDPLDNNATKDYERVP